MPKNLLLVEYEPRYIERVQTLLAGKGVQLDVVKNGEEAVTFCQSQRPDLVLISSVLPKMRTPEVLREIQTLHGRNQVPILLMVSGYRGKDRKADAEKVGAYDILEKPFDEESFFAKVGQVIPASELGMSSAPPKPGRSALTSDQIFGEMLSEVAPSGEQRTEKVRAPGSQSDRRLEETLSGLMANAAPKRRKTELDIAVPLPPASPAAAAAQTPPTAAAVPPPAPVPPTPVAADASTVTPTPAAPSPRPSQTLALDLSDARQAAVAKRPTRPTQTGKVDALLSETLSGLEITAGGSRKLKRDSIPASAGVKLPEAVAKEAAPPVVARAAQPAPSLPTPASAPTPLPAPAAVPPPAPRPAAPPEAKRPAAPPAPTETTVTDGVEFGKYVLLEKIATGGMAEVFKARMRGVEGFQKIVAIKRILPHMSDNEDFVTMFMDEAKLAAQLTHANIVHIYDLDRIGDSYYIAMEYIDGRDLRSILREAHEKSFGMPVALVLFIVGRVASALDHAHTKRDFDGRELNLVHRDVSPQNILMSRQGEVKLCDFGIAKAAVKSSHTQSGALKGKLQYMSPEQAWGRHVDHRSDVFSLGAVAWEMLCGRRLFMGETELSILEQVREGRVEPPSHYNSAVTSEIDRIVLKALGRDPKDRYDYAAEMERDIDEVLRSFRPAPGPMDLRAYLDQLAKTQVEAPENPFEKALAVAVEESKAGVPEPPAAEFRAPEPPVVAKLTPPVVEAPKPAPVVEVPKPAPVAAPLPVEVPKPSAEPPKSPAFDSVVPEAPKSKTGLFVGLGLAAVAIGGIAVYLMKGKTEAPVEPSQQPPPATTTAPPATDPAATTAPSIDAEVQRQIEEAKKKMQAELANASEAERKAAEKKLEDEKKRIEEEARAKAAAAAAAEKAAAEKAKATDAKPVETPATQPPAPEPASAQPPAPEPAASTPPPAAELAAEQVKEGDLVGPGPGVTPPELTSSPKPNYPPIAKRQRMEATVILQALVDENGNVAQTRVLRGNPTFNDAAVDAIAKAKFKPATKNGVRVKMWKTIEVPFKL